jgi:hypothetical protein
VSGTCETHLALAAEITPGDGSIIIVGGNYAPSVSTTGNFVGTTSCNAGHTTEPLTLSESVQWWPISPSAPLSIKADGRLEDSYTDAVVDGKTVTAQWSLVPVP